MVRPRRRDETPTFGYMPEPVPGEVKLAELTPPGLVGAGGIALEPVVFEARGK